MTCTIIAAIVTCVVSSSEHKPTAAEAVRIFSAASTPFAFVVPIRDDGPHVYRTGSSGPTLGPWEMPPLSPARRLDGTLLTNPPADYWSQPTIILAPYIAPPHFRPSTIRPR